MASRWLDTGQNQYYRPYIPSDSEDSEWDSSDYDSPPDSPKQRPENAIPDFVDPRTPHPDFRKLAQALLTPLTPAAGPTFTNEEDEIRYINKRIDPRTYAYPYKPPKAPPESTEEKTRTISTGKPVNSVIMLQSRDRDRNVYPQPTACQLFLPRDYKNITSFSIAQINFTSAFFYFSQIKNNVGIQISEQGSLLFNPVLAPPTSTTPLLITNYIREGSYNISDLLAEIQLQLNKVPIFYDFIGGFTDFKKRFEINGDYSINFNYPGDTYFDALRKVYINTPTKGQIVYNYFQSQYANKSDITTNQSYVAYYYPVLKEYILDSEEDSKALNYTSSGLGVQETIDYLLYSFQGIDDTLALNVIKDNTTALDNYRLLHTFRYSLVNQYKCSYNTTNNRVIIQATGLNSSLSSLLDTQFTSYLSQQLSKYNISSADYNNLANSNSQLMSILQNMYDIIQSNMATYFAVSYGTYSRSYYATPTNTVFIENGLDVSGVEMGYNPANPIFTNSSDILNGFRAEPPKLWPRMTNLINTEGPPRNMGGSNIFPEGSNFPYNIYKNTIDVNFTQDPQSRFIDSSNFTIYTDTSKLPSDILVDIKAGKYTIFQFRSKYRQTLQVETMPRPIKYRYPAWNKANISSTDNLYSLFDTEYRYSSPTAGELSRITPYNISFNPVYGWSNLMSTTSNFGIGITNSRAFWTTNTEQLIITNSNGLFYSIQTPSADTIGSNIYKFSFNITFETGDSTNFVEDLYAFFYHDIGALSADIALSRNESPVHYKKQIVISKQTSSNTFNFNAYANQNYYLLVRSSNLSPQATRYRIVPWFPNGTTATLLSNGNNFDSSLPPVSNLNYYEVAKNNDPDYIRMPLGSNLWGRSQPDQVINQVEYKTPVPIGYDTNGISTDLTDYLPYSNSIINPVDFTARVRIDPLTKYIFQYNSPYDKIRQTYMSNNNVILTTGGVSQYTPTTISTKQYKIVNYNSPLYIQNYTDTYNSLSPYIQPYKDTTTGGKISNYSYDSNAGNVLKLGEGVCGFMFIPAQGTWAIDRITFKTNFINPNAGNNLNIHLLAVYSTTDLNPASINFLNLSKAVAICLRSAVNTYSNASSDVDSMLGTYYTFSNCPALVKNTATIAGFDQMQKALVTNQNAYYSAIVYTLPNFTGSNWNIHSALSTIIGNPNILSNAVTTNIQNITGSAIPYPYANTAFTSNTFYDGQPAPTGYGVVLSTSDGNSNSAYGPSIVYDESALQYEQSIPWVNSHMHYRSRLDVIYDSNAFYEWTGMPITHNSIHATVPNYMLFNGGSISISKYTTYSFLTPGADPLRTFSNVDNFTVDTIFPYKENTNLIAISGNTKEYCFLGAKATSNPAISQLCFKVYNPLTRILTTLPTNSNYTFRNSLLLQGFVFHNTRAWFLTAASYVDNTVIFQGDTSYQTSSNTLIRRVFMESDRSEIQMDPSGPYVYLAAWEHSEPGFRSMQMYSLNSNAGDYYVRSNGCFVELSPASTNNSINPLVYYTNIAVNTTILGDQVYLTNFTELPSRFCKVMSYHANYAGTGSNAEIILSPFDIVDSNSESVTPSRLVAGAGGSLWLDFHGSQSIMGNRNDSYDVETGIETAWQIFFPTVKIEMRRLTNNYNAILDTTNLDSNGYFPEWPHTAMFSYKGLASLTNDISTKWGNETKANFLTSDISFNGFYFNSYIANIPLLPNYINGGPSTDYYLAVRGWLPTEGFQTYMRFYLPNQYDFGYVRLTDISDEIVLGITAPHPNNFSPQYLTNLLAFNNDFVFTNKIMGENQAIGFPGVSMSSSNFGNFINQYKNLFSTLSTNEIIIYDVQSTTTGLINNFISSEMKYILPPNALTRQRYTDPVLFKINWASQLSPNYLQLVDQWGLGWNLGYAKQNTGFSMIHTAPSFYKIQDDYIYLRLNPEFNINRMDSGSKENYTLTREPGGTTHRYYAKLLLTSFGGNATTFIHNPVELIPPINRLSKLEFQWIGPDGLVINNNDAEWDMVVNITETADVIPLEGRSVVYPRNVAFLPVRKDAPSMKGDALSEEEMETLTEPEPAGEVVEESDESSS
jgi:hypothetical protein